MDGEGDKYNPKVMAFDILARIIGELRRLLLGVLRFDRCRNEKAVVSSSSQIGQCSIHETKTNEIGY